MWDVQYYLEKPWYSDDLNPTSVVTTVDLPPIFFANKIRWLGLKYHPRD
jgi:hypothetical protein